MQSGNNGIQQALQQCEQIVQQLINQTQQASHNYQMLLQQEQQNAQRLEELAQREHRAAQTIQVAMQGHQTAIQQLQHVTQLCRQVEQIAQSQQFNTASFANAQQHNPSFSQQGIGGYNPNFRSMQ